MINQGDLCARHFSTGRPIRILWQNGRISNILQANKPVPKDLWIAPALVDLQVNGYGGVDFQQDDLPLSQLITASRGLARSGCTRYLLTLVSDHWGRLTKRLRHLRQLRNRSVELRHAIVGWHIEGPFLSAEAGFCGAHDPEVMMDPSPERVRELREITRSDPLLITLAPEREQSIAAIELAVSLGIKISLGHTNASWSQLQKAVGAGASAFTHLGNGCPRTLDRHDNILWRVFETPGLHVGLIPDGIHVSPELFRLIHRTLGSGSLFYVTDAMAAAGAQPGRYSLGRLQLEVGKDQVVRLPGTPNLAGSALRPIDGMFRAAHMLRTPWQEVWTQGTVIPSRFIGLPEVLQGGSSADFCVLRVSPGGALSELRTFAHGTEVT